MVGWLSGFVTRSSYASKTTTFITEYTSGGTTALPRYNLPSPSRGTAGPLPRETDRKCAPPFQYIGLETLPLLPSTNVDLPLSRAKPTTYPFGSRDAFLKVLPQKLFLTCATKQVGV
jgi:hypothetical protein